jgi:hypothetical protein
MVVVIWAAVIVMAISMFLFGALFGSSTDNVTGITIAALICATIATGFILNNDPDTETAKKNNAHSNEKPKNDQRDGGLDPMSLLTPDDIDELRAEVKAQLRQRLLNGGEGELGSLDALLAEQDKPARRR